jgi:tRNA 2-thiouridine synthesizing protein A
MTITEPEPHDTFDAGDAMCGELVLKLKRRVECLASRQVLKLVTRDPGAKADLPAWCRITGHRLVWSNGTTFYIERKET